jgi:hypothetical protein
LLSLICVEKHFWPLPENDHDRPESELWSLS